MNEDQIHRYIVTYVKPIQALTYNGLPYIMEREYFLQEEDYKSFMEICRVNRWKIVKVLKEK